MVAEVKTAVQAVDANLLIGGKTVAGARRMEVFNPAHPAERVGTIARATVEDSNHAVAAGKAAQPAWAAKTFAERAAIMAKALDSLSNNLDERAANYVRENGKTFAEARRELADVAARARFTLELAPELDTKREMTAPNGRTVVRHVPFGVVVSIGPWNAPVSLSCMQLIPALLTGNSVVLKAPEAARCR